MIQFSKGWVTLTSLKNSLNSIDDDVESSIVDQKLKVACMTADFSMQVINRS